MSICNILHLSNILVLPLKIEISVQSHFSASFLKRLIFFKGIIEIFLIFSFFFLEFPIALHHLLHYILDSELKK